MALSHRALTTLDALKAYIPSLRSDDDSQDEVLERLIESASNAAYLYTGREFIGIEDTQPATRQFQLDAATIMERELNVGDLADVSVPDGFELRIKSRDGSYDSGPVDTTYVLADPLIRQAWQPIGYLRFMPGNPDPPRLLPGYYAEVTGTWGFPAVPFDVEQAVIETAAIWFARDVSKFSETFSIAEGRIDRPRGIPIGARDKLRQYRVPGFA